MSHVCSRLFCVYFYCLYPFVCSCLIYVFFPPELSFYNFASLADILYTGTADGRIVKIDGRKIKVVATLGSSPCGKPERQTLPFKLKTHWLCCNILQWRKSVSTDLRVLMDKLHLTQHRKMIYHFVIIRFQHTPKINH